MVKSILTSDQTRVLNLLCKQEVIRQNFYLTGGTALSEYYLHHRLSEDLDFFSPDEVDPQGVQSVIKGISTEAKIDKIDFQQSFNRNLFFLTVGKTTIKTEFTYFPFTQIEKPRSYSNVRVDSLIDIAVNKVFTIYQKPRSRDFIDLYLIMKREGWKFLELCKKARIKFDTNIDMLQMATRIGEAEILLDYPHMLAQVGVKEWQDFWNHEMTMLKNKVLTK